MVLVKVRQVRPEVSSHSLLSYAAVERCAMAGRFPLFKTVIVQYASDGFDPL